ncbi:MAG: hypothetical protein ACSHYC_18095 [Alphaproteobacteria bacterium]
MTRRQLNILIPAVGIAIIVGIVWNWLAGNTGKMVYVLTPADSDDSARIERLITEPIEQKLVEAGGVGKVQTYNVAGLSAITVEAGSFGISIDGLTQKLTELIPPWTVEELTLRPSIIGLDKNDVVHVFRIYNDVSDERLMQTAANLLIGELKNIDLRVFANPLNTESAADEQTYVALGAVDEEPFSEMVESIQNRIPPEVYLSAHYDVSSHF